MSETTEPDAETVTVHGQQPLELPWDRRRVERFTMTTREIGFECASGRWIAAAWTGVPLSTLLDAAAMPPETTHVVFESTDGYRPCLAVRDLVGGLVAYDADDPDQGGFPRLVSSSVPGPRASKEIVEIRPVTLDAEEDPEDYEELDFEED